MQIKGKSVIKQCYCGKIKKHGEFVGIDKEISQNIKMFVEKGQAEVIRECCPNCKKGGQL